MKIKTLEELKTKVKKGPLYFIILFGKYNLEQVFNSGNYHKEIKIGRIIETIDSFCKDNSRSCYLNVIPGINRELINKNEHIYITEANDKSSKVLFKTFNSKVFIYTTRLEIITKLNELINKN